MRARTRRARSLTQYAVGFACTGRALRGKEAYHVRCRNLKPQHVPGKCVHVQAPCTSQQLPPLPPGSTLKHVALRDAIDYLVYGASRCICAWPALFRPGPPASFTHRHLTQPDIFTCPKATRNRVARGWYTRAALCPSVVPVILRQKKASPGSTCVCTCVNLPSWRPSHAFTTPRVPHSARRQCSAHQIHVA